MMRIPPAAAPRRIAARALAGRLAALVGATRAAAPRAPFALLVALALLVAPACGPAGGDASRGAASDATAADAWTCSMHPQIRTASPGDCPICGMDLIPVSTDDAAPAASRVLELSEAAAALAEIATQPVRRRAVSRHLRMVGKLAPDETRMAAISAWFPLRIERLFVDFTGMRVRAGDHLAEVYSPELMATQAELLQAARTERELSGSGGPLAERARATLQAARERLRQWGLTPAQIDAVIERGEPSDRVTLHAPVSGVVTSKNALPGQTVDAGTQLFTIADLSELWVQLDAYESDLPWLHYGQRVDFVTEAWPGETFHGRIGFIDPVLDDRTRTVDVRLEVPNPDGRLRPAMFVRATVDVPVSAAGVMVDAELADMWMCPMHPEVVASEPAECSECGMDLVPTAELGFRAEEDARLPLVIPDTAPLVTGKRAVVYVRRPGEAPVFEGREVVLGPRVGEWFVVEQGLAEGEQVVVNGAFKLDSELQIRGRPSMMNPADDEAAPSEHPHGAHAGPGARPADDGER